MTRTDSEAAHTTLKEYIRRDLAYLSGVSREHLAALDQAHVDSEPSALYRTWSTHSEQAERAVASWVVSNAPGAIPHLREAGLLIWTPEDAFGAESPALVVKGGTVNAD